MANSSPSSIDPGSAGRAATTDPSVKDLSRLLIRALKARYRDEAAELGAIRKHVKPRDIVCDVGANKGGFTYWLSRWCPSGVVVAFEPQPELASRLAGLCRAMRLSNVRIEAKAVYARTGQIDLFVPTGHQPGASLNRAAIVDNEKFASITVPMVSLDEYFGEDDNVTLLKVDVEGAELGVFEGARRILTHRSPLLVFECENRHLEKGRVSDVLSYLADLGYQGHFIWRRRIYPVSQFDENIHQSRQGEWFWKNPDYCNNFIFAKPPS